MPVSAFIQQVIIIILSYNRHNSLVTRYMSAEKKRLDDLVDTVTSPDTTQLSALKQLRQEMEQLQLSGKLDGYGLFVYGVVLRQAELEGGRNCFWHSVDLELFVLYPLCLRKHKLCNGYIFCCFSNYA